eukprot:7811014-Pyramimonas_sp.AAC.1
MKEHITVLEGRALVWALRHRLRNTRSFHARLLFIADSMAAILALCKGRSSSPGLCSVCRQWAALCLASG